MDEYLLLTDSGGPIKYFSDTIFMSTTLKFGNGEGRHGEASVPCHIETSQAYPLARTCQARWNGLKAHDDQDHWFRSLNQWSNAPSDRRP